MTRKAEQQEVGAGYFDIICVRDTIGVNTPI